MPNQSGNCDPQGAGHSDRTRENENGRDADLDRDDVSASVRHGEADIDRGYQDQAERIDGRWPNPPEAQGAAALRKPKTTPQMRGTRSRVERWPASKGVATWPPGSGLAGDKRGSWTMWLESSCPAASQSGSESAGLARLGGPGVEC
jgi:hypothetical protein